MGKGEQCSETVLPFFSGVQVMPKSQAIPADIVVSASSPKLGGNLIVSSPAKLQEEIKPLFFDRHMPQKSNNFFKQPPLTLSVSKTAFADSDAAYINAVERNNRFVSVPLANDLPNEVVSTTSPKMILLPSWEEERKLFFPFVELLAKHSLLGSKVNFRMAPGGQQSGGSGGGASFNGGGGYSNSSSWVIAPTGGHGFGNGGGSSGGDDDDPWRHRPLGNPTPGHYLENFDFDDIVLDEQTQELLRGDLFEELGLNDPMPVDPVFNRTSANTLWEEPSDPAPPTPITPLPNPLSAMSPMMISQPPPSSDIKDLLTIQELMKNPPSIDQLINYPQQPATPTGPSAFLTHQYVSRPVQQTVRPSASVQPSYQELQQPQPRPSQLQQQDTPNFFETTQSRDSTHRLFRVSVRNKHDQMGYKALEHCVALHDKFQTALSQPCNQSVAIQAKAELCSKTIEMTGDVVFRMPLNCMALGEWLESDSASCDVLSRQLIVQQVVNTLDVLFQGENDLCFWGSYQIFVSGKKVYLYIDYSKLLAIQKVYAYSGQQANPRIEDCRVLLELYNKLLKPFIQDNMSSNVKISPQLSSIFNAFGQIVANPSTCLQQMAMASRVIGQRRTCKIHVDAAVGNSSFTFNVYSMEHEPLSQSLGILKNLLPTGCPSWIVLHGDGRPVSVTEVAVVSGSQTYFVVFPAGSGQIVIPGALYI